MSTKDKGIEFLKALAKDKGLTHINLVQSIGNLIARIYDDTETRNEVTEILLSVSFNPSKDEVLGVKTSKTLERAKKKPFLGIKALQKQLNKEAQLSDSGTKIIDPAKIVNDKPENLDELLDKYPEFIEDFENVKKIHGLPKLIDICNEYNIDCGQNENPTTAKVLKILKAKIIENAFVKEMDKSSL